MLGGHAVGHQELHWRGIIGGCWAAWWSILHEVAYVPSSPSPSHVLTNLKYFRETMDMHYTTIYFNKKVTGYEHNGSQPSQECTLILESVQQFLLTLCLIPTSTRTQAPFRFFSDPKTAKEPSIHIKIQHLFLRISVPNITQDLSNVIHESIPLRFVTLLRRVIQLLAESLELCPPH